MIQSPFITRFESKAFRDFPIFRSLFWQNLFYKTNIYAHLYFFLFLFSKVLNCRSKSLKNSDMAPPILSLALPSGTGRVLSLQSHTVQVLFSSKKKIFLSREIDHFIAYVIYVQNIEPSRTLILVCVCLCFFFQLPR